MLPALSIGIFLENFFIKFSSFFEKPVVPITTLFFNLDASLSISNVHFGTVKSIITLDLLKASILFIDALDVIAAKRDSSQRGMDRRILAQLCDCFDNITEHNNINYNHSISADIDENDIKKCMSEQFFRNYFKFT